MFICLANFLNDIKDGGGQDYLPFAFLKVNNTTRAVAAMPQTRSGSQTRGIATFVNTGLVIDSMMLITSWCLERWGRKDPE
jgi:hypothetical protein